MKHNVTKNRPFTWTPARKTALELLVEDRLSDEEIARKVGVCRRTIAYWKCRPEFAAAAQRMLDEYVAELRRGVRRRLGL